MLKRLHISRFRRTFASRKLKNSINETDRQTNKHFPTCSKCSKGQGAKIGMKPSNKSKKQLPTDKVTKHPASDKGAVNYQYR